METLSDLASKCIRCGFCLESCPTFALTGEESESPRGRIYLLRSADAGKLDWADAKPHIDRCLGCRACEPACPSGVEYGALLELARQKLGTPIPQRLLLFAITRPQIFKRVAKISLPGWLRWWLAGRKGQRRTVRQLSRAGSPVDQRPGRPFYGTVCLLEGCAMRVLFPHVNEATKRLVQRVGHDVMPTDLGCCGALQAHSGMLEAGRAMAGRLFDKANGKPIVVNSAGCGSWLKDCKGTSQVYDLSEFLTQGGLDRELALSDWAGSVTYHDACHLAHAQGIRNEPRHLLQAIPGLDLRELSNSDRCCGSGGIYSFVQPDLAERLLDQKVSSINAALDGAGDPIVVMGNPGCQAWIGQAAEGRFRVAHLAEILSEALTSLPPGHRNDHTAASHVKMSEEHP